MELRIRETGEVVSEREFLAMHANTSFPPTLNTAIFNDFGVDVVLEAPAPTTTQYQTAVRNGVVQDSLGNWVYSWTVRDWTADEIAAAKQASVPQEVSRRQFRRALLAMPGATTPNTLLDDVNAFVEANADAATKVDWAEAPTVRRDWPTLLPMAQAMGKTAADLDQVFIAAAAI